MLGLLFAILYVLVFWGPGTKDLGYQERLHPKLGLDLVGGTQATYVASLADGKAPSRESMEESRKIIDQRVNALGVAEAEVVVEGNRNIVVSVAGEANDQLKNVGQAAQMRFRKVLKVTGDNAAVAVNPPTAPPSAAPTGSAAPKPGATTKAPAVTGSGKPSAPTGGQGGGERAPAPSATPSAPASAPAAAPAPAPSGSDPNQPSAEELRAEIQKKVGAEVWAAAGKLTDPVDLSADPTAGQKYKAFSTLSGAEVNALTPEMQFNIPTISCAQLDKRPSGAIDAEKSKVVACQSGAKMYLDVAKVVGTDIDTASPQLDQQSQWVVSLDFTGTGQGKWTELTREAFQPPANDPCLAAAQALSTGATHCLVAVVLDKEVISAPEIQGVLSGQSQITGQFDATSAKELADQIKYGALPVTFEPGTTQTVSATLGIAQLEAGLIAAAIGLGLVAIYAFFYYRLLGSVIFLSLVLSGLLTFGALVVLGRTTGFTLTLAGIAGFIVSLGVAADSFVIYFERLKDEIHEGRSARSAVPRAWARARRTIISANTITIMAAVVLYIVSIGAVKGFAFALGLSTILDLVVVFLFRHPIMTMFANTRAFLSPRVSGLGRALKRAPTEKEA
ncbi:protein translocase subunit SecD [Actinoplanes sp. NBRC 14428]|uniref:Protein translocase subunit SecD n=1 Tax=Pseudosporangium ferrugineum TaxID=439699 RepID=A0A2T0S2D5_9ACTN|nr:preprotein translocase subunit SecD [Pseudosporangium ferrugineum]BCJ55670.1 protein translocase subunit SecD [Actinoplanes sp. NBRC 14428]